MASKSTTAKGFDIAGEVAHDLNEQFVRERQEHH